MMADRLARLAVARESVRRGLETARSCGDSGWVRDNVGRFDSLDRRINILLKVLRPEVVEGAREITNAPI